MFVEESQRGSWLKLLDFKMYAIIETGGKQYSVAPGDEIGVEKLPGEVGSDIEFTNVVAVSKEDGELLAGEDVKSAKVTATIEGHERAKKILVFKFKRRKHYRRLNGHRQDYTQVKIGDIVL